MTGKKIWDDANNTKFGSLVEDLKAYDRRLFLRAKTQVPGCTYGGLRKPVQYLWLRNFVFFFARYHVTPPPNLKNATADLSLSPCVMYLSADT